MADLPQRACFRRRLGLLLAVSALFTVAATAGARASCANNELGYCNILVNSLTFCSDSPPRHTYDANGAHYDGTGSVSVCEDIVGYYSGNSYSWSCAINAEYGDVGCNTDTLMNVYVYNNSPNRHTIRGSGEY